MQQVKLQSGTSVLTCWVDKAVKLGNIVNLKKEPGVWWNVEWCGQPSDFTPNRGWNVGGL